MLNFKILQGTPRSGESLCRTCAMGRVTKGTNLEEVIICGPYTHQPQRVDFIVASCTGYYERGLPTIHDMEQIAWEIHTDNRVSGFAGGSEISERVITITRPEKPTVVVERHVRK